MSRARRRRHYASPAMELLTYERAEAKIVAEERWMSVTQQLPVFGLEGVLLTLPLLFVLSVVEPSRMLLHRVLLGPSPLVWIAWAVGCFCMSLSAEGVVGWISPKARLRGNLPAVLLLMGLGNCLAVVGLLWVAS
jgi:hypothetical protein